MSNKDYQAPWLAELFHKFPHLDLTFQSINNTFNPDNARYREALVFWAALPVLWLLVTLLIFLMYFCYRCCQKEPDKKRRGSCLPWAMAILALLTCGAVGVGFYGNEDAHKGIMQFASATETADETIHTMRREVSELQQNINETIDHRLMELKSFFRNQGMHQRLNRSMQQELTRMTKQARQYTSDILTHVKRINAKAEKVDFSHYVLQARLWDYWRWLGTILLLCWEVLLCLLLLFGIGQSSKCTLLIFCAFGIFTLVLCWVAAGLHLGASVGVGDFCHAPDQYIEKVGYSTMDKEIVKYYIKCNKQVTNPFGQSLRLALDSVTKANDTLNKAGRMASGLVDRSQDMMRLISGVSAALDSTIANLQQLTALVECTNLHKDYKQAVNGVCTMALPGIVFLLLSAAVTGLLLTILVLLASCAWRHFGRRKGYYEIDEDDPFLPRADNNSPSYYSFTRGRHTNPREHVPMQRRSSPPPAQIRKHLRQEEKFENKPEEEQSLVARTGDVPASPSEPSAPSISPPNYNDHEPNPWHPQHMR